MYITSNNTSLQPLRFDFDEFLCRCNIKLSKRESEFASLWNAVAGMLPERMFETNQRGRRGYRDADIIAVRVAMLFLRSGSMSFLALDIHLPTVSQSILRYSATAFLDSWQASHAAVLSKSFVNLLDSYAHGTAGYCTPCSWQQIRSWFVSM